MCIHNTKIFSYFWTNGYMYLRFLLCFIQSILCWCSGFFKRFKYMAGVTTDLYGQVSIWVLFKQMAFWACQVAAGMESTWLERQNNISQSKQLQSAKQWPTASLHFWRMSLVHTVMDTDMLSITSHTYPVCNVILKEFLLLSNEVSAFNYSKSKTGRAKPNWVSGFTIHNTWSGIYSLKKCYCDKTVLIFKVNITRLSHYYFGDFVFFLQPHTRSYWQHDIYNHKSWHFRQN